MLSVLVGLGGFLGVCALLLGKDLALFYDRDSLLLLTIGPIAVIFMSYSFLDFFSGLKTVSTMAFLNQSKEMNSISNLLTQLSQAVRADGVGAVAQQKDKVKNPLFRDGLALILNGFTPDEIRHNLVAKINTRQSQFNSAANLFDSMGKLCPGMGLLGTIIGLMKMLANMSDPKSLGPSMAIALLTTLYGLVFGTVLYNSIADKVRLYAEKSLQLDTMIMEGVLLLKEKKSGAHFRDVLNTYGQSGGAPKGTQTGGNGAAQANGAGGSFGAVPRSRMPGQK
ncbi:MAG: MotA/TolQ/ExbB proton channel family protein [Silvanigrellales bacterium]|jgi:chemotaxis protein MotA|nr:MotA/TolQ/ExbB proton channel family protein [Silvanigrellales bacterium]